MPNFFKNPVHFMTADQILNSQRVKMRFQPVFQQILTFWQMAQKNRVGTIMRFSCYDRAQRHKDGRFGINS